MEIHIGQLIKKRLQETGMSKTEFARRINKTSQNVYDIFERKTIDTGLLHTISSILDFNFFEPYSLAIKTSVSFSVKLNDSDQPLLTAGEMVGSLLQLEQKMNEQTFMLRHYSIFEAKSNLNLCFFILFFLNKSKIQK